MKIRGQEIDPGGVIGWLQEYDPTLLLKLLLLDEFWSSVLFDDSTTHTISWHIATLAKNGNAVCQELCQLLNVLSPNHCANALASGN
jgi:hypothetical protein